jgi:hypothetical protein
MRGRARAPEKARLISHKVHTGQKGKKDFNAVYLRDLRALCVSQYRRGAGA